MGRIDQLSREREEREGGKEDNKEEVEKLEKQLREEKIKKDQAINKLAEMMMRKDLQVNIKGTVMLFHSNQRICKDNCFIGVRIFSTASIKSQWTILVMGTYVVSLKISKIKSFYPPDASFLVYKHRPERTGFNIYAENTQQH